MPEGYSAKERYRGEVAAAYVERRAGRPKWRAEQEAMAGVLARLKPGSRIVDVPFGTGRFLEHYEKCRLTAIGLDVSRDMMREAPASDALLARVGSEIERLPLADRSVDTALCVRLANWLPDDVLERAIAELTRVARTHVVFHVRVSERAGLVELLRARLDALMGAKPGTREPGFVVHPADRVAELFASQGLRLEASEDVDVEFDLARRERHVLRIHLLRKQGPGPGGAQPT